MMSNDMVFAKNIGICFNSAEYSHSITAADQAETPEDASALLALVVSSGAEEKQDGEC